MLNQVDRTTHALTIAAAIGMLPLSSFAQIQFEELPKRHLPFERYETTCVELGDLDGDGDEDAVLGHYYSLLMMQVLLNDGAGVLTPSPVQPTARPRSYATWIIELADFDNDGDLDILSVPGDYPGAVRPFRLHLNDGHGTFLDVTDTHMPAGQFDGSPLTTGDVDGDNDLDLVVGSPSTPTERLLLNDGTARFSESGIQMPFEPGRYANALADVDGDGDLDFVGFTKLLFNDGSGVFTSASATHLPQSGVAVTDYAVADIDNDGDPDLVGVGNEQNRLLLNDGQGLFTEAPGRLPQRLGESKRLAIGDVDADGDFDFVVSCHDYSGASAHSQIFLNDGTGRFVDVTTSHMPANTSSGSVCALGDLDGDGDLDLVQAGWLTDYNRLYLNDGVGRFTDATAQRHPQPDMLARSRLVDVDGDDDLDLISVRGRQERVSINDGRGWFRDETATRMPVGVGTTGWLALGDIDSDGDIDIASSVAWNRILVNDGRGRFTDETTARMPAQAYRNRELAFGDVDGDGDLDLVGASLNQQNRLYLNDGGGRFSDATSGRLPSETHNNISVVLADLDGDDDLDLVFGRQSYPDDLYLNDGTGTFTDVTASHMPAIGTATSSLAVGDVDGDGDLDLLVAIGNFSSGDHDRLFLNDGRAHFTDASDTHLPGDIDFTSLVALEDLDADGDLDLFCTNLHSGDTFYLNDGSGRFVRATSRIAEELDPQALGLTTGDIDGDGDTDVVADRRVLLNLMRQLDAPWLLRVGHDYRLDVYARFGPFRSADLAFPFLSPAPGSIPFPPFGTIRIDPNQVIPLPPVLLPQPDAAVSVTVAIPNDATLVGATIHGQALILQIPGTAFLTNAIADVVLP